MDLRTVEDVDERILAIWHHLGSPVKASAEAARVRIDRLLEERYALQSAPPEPKADQ